MQDHKEFDFTLKIVIIGDVGVGKTSLLNCYMSESNPLKTKATIGVDYKPILINKNGKTIKVNFWDTSGQERYRSMSLNYYKGANGIILVYDTTRKETFTNLEYWLQRIKEHAPEDVKIMLIGNKIDLIEEKKVSSEEGNEFAQKSNFMFMETSAMESSQELVKQSFGKLCDNALVLSMKKEEEEMKQELNKTKRNSIKLISPDQILNKKSCC